MKYLGQFCIIAVVSFSGEVLKELIPLPVPGSVYGLLIMFLLLLTGVLQFSQVEDVADWMISIMPIFFIPPTVLLITVVGGLSMISIVAVVVISIISTVVVMVVTGHTSQAVIRYQRKRERNE